jgi:hypothetical protein
MRLRARLLLVGVCFSIGCQASSAPQGTTVQLERLAFSLPPAWQQVPPSSGMRVAQASIPGPGGAAEMAVFHFGAGQGGDVEANLQRWINQVVPDAGSVPQRESFDSGALRITRIDVAGTLKPGGMGMAPSAAQPHSRLLGAVIEGDGGPWFIKVTGDDATVAPQRDAFVAMLHSAKSTS